METAFTLNRLTQHKPKTGADCFDIMSVLGRIRDELEHAQNLFDSVIEPELVDCYTYELMALKIKYCYYLNLYKKYGKETAL